MITAKPIQWLAATESGGPLFHCHGCSSRPTVKHSYCQDFLRQETILNLVLALPNIYRPPPMSSAQTPPLLPKLSPIPWIDASLKLSWCIRQLNLCFQYEHV